jgi:Histidine kinase-, DNA gyrase B-, and HSP90-like ATPase
MTRWSLRRHRPQTGNADASTRRPDDYRPDPYQPAHANRQDAVTPPEGYPPASGYPTAAEALPFTALPGSATGLPQPRGYAADSYPRAATFTPQPPGTDPAASRLPGGAWPDICEQFGLQLLVLAEQLRISLDELEADEADPDRLHRLYRIDHAVTRMRRASRDLRTLAGRGGEELAGPVTSLLDVIRMALSAIERYTQVTVAKVTDLAVLGYAADDIGSLMAALLDNATRYSPGPVTVSAHLTEDGSVLFRVEDTGIGIAPDMVAGINAMLAGPVREIDERAGLRTGFPVVHRIARKHQVGVRLAARPSPASGIIAMVTLPAQLLCEIPDTMLGRPAPPPAPRPPADSVTVLPSAARRRPPAPGRTRRTGPAERPDWLEPPGGLGHPGGAEPPGDEPAPSDGLPRRERASLRGDAARRDTSGDSESSPEISAEVQAAARRAFADDITAFSLGSQELGSQESTGKGTAP